MLVDENRFFGKKAPQKDGTHHLHTSYIQKI
jgi:hypothetical protein